MIIGLVIDGTEDELMTKPILSFSICGLHIFKSNAGLYVYTVKKG